VFGWIIIWSDNGDKGKSVEEIRGLRGIPGDMSSRYGVNKYEEYTPNLLLPLKCIAI